MNLCNSLILLLMLQIESNVVIKVVSAKTDLVAEDEGSARHKRHLRFPFNGCIALAMVLAIPLKLKNRSAYLSYNFETNYYLPYFDKRQGLVPLPFATIDEPGVNTGTILAYETNIPERFRKLDDNSIGITQTDNSTESANVTQVNEARLVQFTNLTESAIKSDQQEKPTLKKNPKTKINNSEEVEKAAINDTDEKPKKTSVKSKQKRGILNTLLSRKKFYKILINKLENSGFQGEACLLKTICETSEQPLGDFNGVLGDIVHVMFTPSSSRNENLPLKYYEAEQDGNLKDCKKYDYDCPSGIYDYISLIK